MRSTPKIKLSYHDQSDHVRYVTKIRSDNDMIDRMGLVYAEIKIELLEPI